MPRTRSLAKPCTSFVPRPLQATSSPAANAHNNQHGAVTCVYAIRHAACASHLSRDCLISTAIAARWLRIYHLGH